MFSDHRKNQQVVMIKATDKLQEDQHQSREHTHKTIRHLLPSSYDQGINGNMNYLELQNYHNDGVLSATADNVCKSITIAATVCISRLFHISIAATVDNCLYSQQIVSFKYNCNCRQLFV